MFKKISRIAITLLGLIGGIAFVDTLRNWSAFSELLRTSPLKYSWVQYLCAAAILALSTLLAWLLSGAITKGIEALSSAIDHIQEDKSLPDIMLELVAIVLGLVIAYLFSNLTNSIPGMLMIKLTINVIIYLLCPYVCARIFWKRKRDMQAMGLFRRKDGKNRMGSGKIMDASVLIDGRIYDICKIGFIEGVIIIPDFVVEEITALSQCDDEARANRAAKALGLIKKLHDELRLPVEVKHIAYDDVHDYDVLLLRYAQEHKATIITTDNGLKKAATLQKIKVLNINELTNALKTALVPGDTLDVRILKPGKEKSQGLAYLDDGTMIVVENGIDYVGQNVTLTVTNVMQTAAGRMIFARI